MRGRNKTQHKTTKTAETLFKNAQNNVTKMSKMSQNVPFRGVSKIFLHLKKLISRKEAQNTVFNVKIFDHSAQFWTFARK
jgi:N-glycosylase/DNA lyase